MLKGGLANDLVFHAFPDNSIVLALGLDNGAVTLYHYDADLKNEEQTPTFSHFSPILTLTKHEDWVRCLDFVNLGIFCLCSENSKFCMILFD